MKIGNQTFHVRTTKLQSSTRKTPILKTSVTHIYALSWLWKYSQCHYRSDALSRYHLGCGALKRSDIPNGSKTCGIHVELSCWMWTFSIIHYEEGTLFTVYSRGTEAGVSCDINCLQYAHVSCLTTCWCAFIKVHRLDIMWVREFPWSDSFRIFKFAALISKSMGNGMYSRYT